MVQKTTTNSTYMFNTKNNYASNIGYMVTPSRAVHMVIAVIGYCHSPNKLHVSVFYGNSVVQIP